MLVQPFQHWKQHLCPWNILLGFRALEVDFQCQGSYGLLYETRTKLFGQVYSSEESLQYIGFVCFLFHRQKEGGEEEAAEE